MKKVIDILQTDPKEAHKPGFYMHKGTLYYRNDGYTVDPLYDAEQVLEDYKFTEWQPIETAPKDRPILGYDGITMTTIEWAYLTVYGKDFGYWNLVECGTFAENGEWLPAFWMPLPEPPKI